MHQSLYKRSFLLLVGIAAISLVIGGVGFGRGKDREQLATRVRELESQLNAKGVIDETAASTGPAESQPASPAGAQPTVNSKPKQIQKNVAQAAAKPTEEPPQNGPAQVIAIGAGEATQSSQSNWSPPATGATPSPIPALIPTVAIKIQHLGTFTPALQAGDTALSALKRAGQQNGFRVRTTEFPPYGEFVDCLGDLCFDDHHYWAFYFNGQYSNVGAGSQPVIASDTTEWKWEAF